MAIRKPLASKTRANPPKTPAKGRPAGAKAPAYQPTPQRPATGLKTARKGDAGKPPSPTPKAAPGKAPLAAPGKAPPAPSAAGQPDPLPPDARRMPGAYRGVYNGNRTATCIAYKRTDDVVLAVHLGQPIHLKEWRTAMFEREWQPLLKLGEHYPLDRAVKLYLESYNGHTDKALNVLKRLRDGRSVDEEDTIDDILDVAEPRVRLTRSTGPREHRQALPPSERKLLRRQKRKERLASMAPAELLAWKTKRKERRAARRAARKVKQ